MSLKSLTNGSPYSTLFTVQPLGRRPNPNADGGGVLPQALAGSSVLNIPMQT